MSPDPILDGAPSPRLSAHEIRKTEMAFRRGFSHAAQYAFDAICGGATKEDIGKWLDAVDAWRFDRTCNTPIVPPGVFNRKRGHDE